MNSRLRDVPPLILWQNGMLLLPQHFENLVDRCEQLIAQTARNAAPFNWGVLACEFDDAQLIEGKIVLAEFEAILPDGTPVWHSATTGAAVELDLTKEPPALKSGPFTVYATVPANLSRDPLNDRYRMVDYTPEEIEKAETDFEAPTPRQELNLKLHAGHKEPGVRLLHLPIAQYKFENGVFGRVDTFTPPAIRLQKSSPAGSACIATLRHVRETAKILHQDQEQLSPADRKAMDFTRRIAVQQLVAMLPATEALVESGEIHPFEVYVAFCSIAGHIAGISSDPMPPAFARYQHSNAGQNFNEVLTYIERILAENGGKHYDTVPFTQDGNTFSVAFRPEWSKSRLILNVIPGKLSLHDAALWVQQSIIAADSSQERMLLQRTPGIHRQRIEHEPGIFSDPGNLLFHLLPAQDDLQSGDLLEVRSVLSRSDVAPAGLTLYIVHEPQTHAGPVARTHRGARV